MEQQQSISVSASRTADASEVQQRVQEVVSTHWVSDAMAAAFELDLPGHLQQPQTGAQLAVLTNQPTSVVVVLAQALVSIGLVTREPGPAYLATPGLRDAWADGGAAIRALIRGEFGLSTRLVEIARTRGTLRVWSLTEETVLESMGSQSGKLIAWLAASVIPALSDLEQRLRGGGAAFLDVGAGVAGVTIAMCQVYPTLHAVALEPASAPRALARQHIEEAKMRDRIDVRSQTVQELTELEAFDVAWVAGDFVAADQLPTVFVALHRALKPGGWALIGSLHGPDDSLPSIVARLRAAAAGGDAPGPTVTTAMLRDAGFTEIRQDLPLPNGIVPLYARK